MPAPVALSKPTETERGEWYFQRYVEHLPSAGNMVVLDRSWYNRAGVERVLGFCAETEATKFLEEAPLFEAGLMRDGIILIKLWLTVGREMRLKALPCPAYTGKDPSVAAARYSDRG